MFPTDYMSILVLFIVYSLQRECIWSDLERETLSPLETFYQAVSWYTTTKDHFGDLHKFKRVITEVAYAWVILVNNAG